MKRRAVLAAVAQGCSAAAWLPAARAAAPLAGSVLVWGADRCLVAGPAGAVRVLPDRLAAGVRPALTARGLWLANERGALRAWASDDAGAWQLQRTVELATPVHALVASADGHWVAAAHGERLSLLDAGGAEVKSFDGIDLARTSRGAASALFMLPQRRSVVAAWPALGEVWEISLDPRAAPIFDGLVHDYRMGEAIAKPGHLGARRAPLGRPLPDLSFADARLPWLAGTQGAEVVVMHLDVRRRIAALPANAAKPAGATLRRAARGQGAFYWWLPAGQEIHVFDTTRWVRTEVHTLPGPVRHLQVVGDAVDAPVWALVDERGGPGLWRHNGQSGWHAVGSVAGPAVALGGMPQGPQLLVLRSDPPTLLRLDHHGGLLAHWPLPAGTAWQGVAAWPLA